MQPFDEDKHCCQIINLVRMMHEKPCRLKACGVFAFICDVVIFEFWCLFGVYSH